MKVAPAIRGGQGGRRRLGLPRLPQDRRERQQRARARTDPDRRSASRARRSSARSRSGRASCPPSATCRRRSSTSWPTSSPRSTSLAPMPGPKPSRDSRPVRGAGQPHVRPDRRSSTTAQLGDDRRPAPPLARAGRRPGRARARATRRSTSAAAPATWRSSWPAGSRPAATSSAATSPSRCSTWPARRPAGAAPHGVRFEWADALELPYDDGRFDAVTVGFGVRNLADLDRGLRGDGPGPAPGRPARRSSRSPSRTRPPLSTFFSLWFDRIVPLLGSSPATPRPTAYLPESVRSFPDAARPGAR